MPRETDSFTKHTINLYSGDLDWLQQTYPTAGASKIIRELVRAHIEQIDGKLTQAEVTVKLEGVLA